MQHKQPADAGELGNIDLTPKQHLEVTRLLKQHVPNTLVWAHGSRVTFKSQERHASDLDLVVFSTRAQTSDVYNLREALEESDLPFSVDVLMWCEIPDHFKARMKQAYYVVQEDKPSDLPDGWRRTTLRALADIKHGFAFSGEHIVTEETSRILMTPGHFAIGGGFRHNHKKYFDSANYKDGYELGSGDLVVTMTDLSKTGDTLGYGALVPTIKDKVLLHNQRIGKVLLKGGALDKNFCHYLLRSKGYRHHVLATCSGSTVKHTSPTKILDYEFDLPSITDQKAIADILGALDDKIEVNRKMNQTLEDIAKAFFKSWFVDFDPIRAKMALKTHSQSSSSTPSTVSERNGVGDKAWSVEQAQAYIDQLDPAIAALFPDELVASEIGEIPKGWGVAPLDQIGNFRNGLALQKYPAVEGEEKLPVVKIAQLRKGSTDGDDLFASGVPADFVITDGDYVFSWSGSLMAKYWAGGRGALNQHLFKVEEATQPLWFVGGWVEHFMPEFKSIAESKATTMGHIKREHLKQAVCPIPSTRLIERCAGAITPLVERSILSLQETKVIAELRDTLLPKLISGELRIPDAERLLEVVDV